MPSNKRTLIKLDDKVIELKTTEDGTLKAFNVDDDSVFDMAVLEGGLEGMLQNAFNTQAQAAYNELLTSLKTGIQTSVLRTLGFERDSWSPRDGWRVDHCNGRMSEMTQYLSQKVKDALRQEADKLIESEKDKVFKEVRAAIKKEFKQNFMYAVSTQVASVARDAADEFLKEMVAEEVKKISAEATLQAKASLLGLSVPAAAKPSKTNKNNE